MVGITSIKKTWDANLSPEFFHFFLQEKSANSLQKAVSQACFQNLCNYDHKIFQFYNGIQKVCVIDKITPWAKFRWVQHMWSFKSKKLKYLVGYLYLRGTIHILQLPQSSSLMGEAPCLEHCLVQH